MRQLYEAILGRKNRIFYLTKFEHFDQQGLGLKASWNWPAFLCGGVWALYRKMYGWSFAFLGIAIFSNIFEKAGSPGLGAIIFIGPWIAFAIYANSLYHSSVKKKIAVAQLSVQDEPKLLELLNYKGGAHTWVIWVFGMLPVIGILAAIAIPAYHDYTVRSKMAGVQKPPANQALNSHPASRSYPQNDLTASGWVRAPATRFTVRVTRQRSQPARLASLRVLPDGQPLAPGAPEPRASGAPRAPAQRSHRERIPIATRLRCSGLVQQLCTHRHSCHAG